MDQQLAANRTNQTRRRAFRPLQAPLLPVLSRVEVALALPFTSLGGVRPLVRLPFRLDF